jgi:hypothetical protein
MNNQTDNKYHYVIDMDGSQLLIKEQDDGSITFTAEELGQIFSTQDLTTFRIYKDVHQIMAEIEEEINKPIDPKASTLEDLHEEEYLERMYSEGEE